jgi:hypothetical protein
MNKEALTGLVCGVLLTLPFTPAAAQDLVKFPTGPAAWTVTVVPSPSASASTNKLIYERAAQVTGMSVTQDTEKRRATVTWSDGKTTERWEIFSFNLLFTEDSAGQVFWVDAGGKVSWIAAIPFVPSTFSWLRQGLLQEKDPIAYHDMKCFHYKGTVRASILSGDGLDTGSVTAEAWIDSLTGLPVALDNGATLGTFKFQKTPPPPLTLPPKYELAYTKFKFSRGIVNPVVLPTPPPGK